MSQIEKRIKINNNRTLIYNITKDSFITTYTIKEIFLENNKLKKIYTLSMWDDYNFNSYVDSDDTNDIVSYEFDKDHPLFLALFHLLNYDEELLIDDDSTMEDDKKYMLIKRIKDKIYILFVNKLGNNEFLSKEFNVFIKNILYDGRSKIDSKSKDTKIRLNDFFNEVYEDIINEYHQISIEEYLLNNSDKKEYQQIKKSFQKIKN